jgi:SAM-dependent methyltransferase
MDDEQRAQRARSFGPAAEAYERARPAYPDDAVSWLAGAPVQRVVDVGAGTGKLTARLVRAGHDVVAVEPDDAMRGLLERAVPGVRQVLAGTAEDLPLAHGSADVVTVAQAWHWVDPLEASREIARVLRPGGVLALVWNIRRQESPAQQELSEVIGSEDAGDATDDLPATLQASGRFGPVEHATFPHEHRLERTGLLDLVASRSNVAVLAPQARSSLLEEVGRVFDRHATGGVLAVEYRAECYRTARLS